MVSGARFVQPRMIGGRGPARRHGNGIRLSADEWGKLAAVLPAIQSGLNFQQVAVQRLSTAKSIEQFAILEPLLELCVAGAW